MKRGEFRGESLERRGKEKGEKREESLDGREENGREEEIEEI